MLDLAAELRSTFPSHRRIVFRCRDGRYIAVGNEVVKESSVLMNTFLFAMVDDDVPLLQIISGDTIEHIRKLCAFFKYKPPFDRRVKSQRPSASDPVLQYLRNLSKEQLEELNGAIDFLDMPRLAEYTLYFALSLMKGKDLHGLRTVFGLRDDYTDLEELEDLAKHGV
uniref:Skp1 domain-containing protein n=1 Tax=Panagrellus redivivus TaxID=6233 RepID=A0A7E4V9E8_PANRE